MLTKRDKQRICDKAMQLNIQHQKGEITLKEQNDTYWKFIKELEENNATAKNTKVPVPEFISIETSPNFNHEIMKYMRKQIAKAIRDK